MKENGPDPVQDKEIVTEEWLAELLGRKHVPVKALLLDQANISGIGNWVGDELLYDAKIHPEQYSNTLTKSQITDLHKSIHYVCGLAVELLADSEKFPEGWLFKHRWGKGKKDASKTLPNGARITFLTVGGRTSAVIPSVQRKTGPVAGDVKSEDAAGEGDDNGIEKKSRKLSKKRKVKDEDEVKEDGEKDLKTNGDSVPEKKLPRQRKSAKRRESEVPPNGDTDKPNKIAKKQTARKQEASRPMKKAKAEDAANEKGRRRSARVSERLS